MQFTLHVSSQPGAWIQTHRPQSQAPCSPIATMDPSLVPPVSACILPCMSHNPEPGSKPIAPNSNSLPLPIPRWTQAWCHRLGHALTLHVSQPGALDPSPSALSQSQSQAQPKVKAVAMGDFWQLTTFVRWSLRQRARLAPVRARVASVRGPGISHREMAVTPCTRP